MVCTRPACRITAESADVGIVIAAHVVGGETTIQLKRVLVTGHAARISVDVLARLEDREGRSVASRIWKVKNYRAAQRCADCGIQSLQFSAGSGGDFDGRGSFADL